MNLRHRTWALLLALLATFALVASACGDDAGDDDADGGDTPTTEAADDGEGDGGEGEGAVASDVVLGGPPDCPTNPGCIPGLQDGSRSGP